MAHPNRTLARLRANLLVHLRMKGVRQGEMARALDRTEAWVSQVLSGKRAVRLDVIDRIADYFGVDPGVFFDDLDAPQNEGIFPYALETGVLPAAHRARRATDRDRTADYLWSENQRLRAALRAAATSARTLHEQIDADVVTATARSRADSADQRRLDGARPRLVRRRRPTRANVR